MGILDRSVNLLALLQTREIGKRPLCLIGHSLGGLMAKQMLLQAAAIAPEYQELATHLVFPSFLVRGEADLPAPGGAECMGGTAVMWLVCR